MPRQCQITGKKTATGNNVSHAKNRTRRTFGINLHTKNFYSVKLGRRIKVRLTKAGLRNIDKCGGIDGYIEKHPEFLSQI